MNMEYSQDSFGDDSDHQSNSGGQGNKDQEIVEKERFARESHCEIERRRRTKMTAYINELCDMVPSCTNLTRKPDKLTILRMAVAHMKTLRGTGNTGSNGEYKPSFLNDQELKHLVLEAADGFLFVVRCDSGEIMYLNDSITSVLNHSHREWVHRSIFDLVHSEDADKVREQLSLMENTSGRMLDMKTGTVKKDGHHANMRMCLGARRGFICRMRIGNVPVDSSLLSTHTVRHRQRQMLGPSRDGHHYAVVHVTGYIKNWPSQHTGAASAGRATAPVVVGVSGEVEEDNSGHSGSNQCLVAIARLQVTSQPNMGDLSPHSQHEFVTRQACDSKISFCDQRVFNVLAYQPHELLGKMMYDFVHIDDHAHLKQVMENVLKPNESGLTVMLHLRAKTGEFVAIRTHLYCFRNPYSDEIEYIVSSHTSAKSLQQAAAAANEVNALGGSGPGADSTVVMATAAMYNQPSVLLAGGMATIPATPASSYSDYSAAGGYDYAAGRPSAIRYTAGGTNSSAIASVTTQRNCVGSTGDSLPIGVRSDIGSSWNESDIGVRGLNVSAASSYGNHPADVVGPTNLDWYGANSKTSASAYMYSRYGAPSTTGAYWNAYADPSGAAAFAGNVHHMNTELSDFPDMLRGVLTNNASAGVPLPCGTAGSDAATTSSLVELGFLSAAAAASGSLVSGAYAAVPPNSNGYSAQLS